MADATLDLVVAKLDEVYYEQKSQRMEIAEVKKAITQLQVRDEERWPHQQSRVATIEKIMRELEHEMEDLKRALAVHKTKIASVGAIGGGLFVAFFEVMRSLIVGGSHP